MNKRAAAYLAEHSVTKLIDGIPELMLPLDKLQGFLDLLGPSDVPSYHYVQRLYRAQATAVESIKEQIAQHDLKMKAVRKTVTDENPSHAGE
jgi:hypothetical protein